MSGDLGKRSSLLILRAAVMRGRLRPGAAGRARYAPKSVAAAGVLRVALTGVAECLFDPPLRQLVLTVDALGVNLSSTASLCDPLGGRDTAVEPGGDAGVPQVVHTTRAARSIPRRSVPRAVPGPIRGG